MITNEMNEQKPIKRRMRIPKWRQPDGQQVSCVEKLKVLNENLEEIREMCAEAFEDAILMGCDEEQFRQVIHDMAKDLENPYQKKKK